MLLKDKEVVIRKDRQCFSCLRKFPTGTKMKYWVSIYEGDFNTGYVCSTCIKIMNKDKENNEYPEGYVEEVLNKDETPEELLGRL